MRRAGGSTSDQSVTPVAAEHAAPANPIAIDASAAYANSRPERIKLKASNIIAAVQAPIGISVRTTCSGSPNQVPFRKFLSRCALGRPPAYKALSTSFCSLSSIGWGPVSAIFGDHPCAKPYQFLDRSSRLLHESRLLHAPIRLMRCQYSSPEVCRK